MTRARALAWIACASLPLAALGARALHARRDAAARAAEPPAAPAPAPALFALGGEAALPGGGALRVHLERLHADPARQAFDARALGERLGLAAGEPFLCSVERSGPAPEPGAAPLDLGAPRVLDAAGDALVTPLGRSAARALDPLSALLAAPPAPAPGEAAEFVLWGREPRAPARLLLGAGLAVDLAAAEASADGHDVPIARAGSRAAEGRAEGAR